MKTNTLVTICLFSVLICTTACQKNIEHDIVLKGGRVMDPETELDEILNVGIVDNQITTISKNALLGSEILDVSGLVVSPGFIDLHVHGMTNEAHKYQVRDGVTTALELESGKPFFKEWLESKRDKSIVNYGATVSHAYLRVKAMPDYAPLYKMGENSIAENGFNPGEVLKLRMNLGRASYQSLSGKDIENLLEYMIEDLERGALGIGVPVGYYPGASAGEIFKVYELAADQGVPVFSHTRGFGMPGIHEAIANATSSGAPLHIVHANSLSLGEIQVTLDMVASAQKRGLDITTEVYPYTAASTRLESTIFDEGWQEELAISYGDIQWEETGERLTEATFKEYREEGGTVIIHMMKPEWIVKGIQDKRTMIASDGMPYAPMAHPRTAGTFSRVLGRYVREQKVVSLMDALKKMTIMPAQRLENVSNQMLNKGRLQVGMDADITIFDPNEVIDKADFKGLQYSVGIPHVMIAGKWVVKNGNHVENVFPGEAILNSLK